MLLHAPQIDRAGFGVLAYDIFLSHAAADMQAVDGVRSLLIRADFRVYCDRYDDPMLDRSHVSAATADRLKMRMRSCNAMVYVVTAQASVSKWMPWELGFFDGVRGKVLIYPVDEEALAAAKRQEYLSLFKILKPGQLARQLKDELDDPAGPFAELRKQPMFAPADADATYAYAGRMRDINPFDLAKIAETQGEIWKAWLRLWGLK
jgi:hypothetical protein